MNTVNQLLQRLIVHVNMSTLSPAAQAIVEKYLQLPLVGTKVNAPYFNNQRSKVRAGLAALIGKGNPEDIALEAELTARTKHFPITTATATDVKKFLVEQNLGVDCSAFAYYVLRYEGIVKNKKDLQSSLHFPQAKSLFRKLIVRLRPVENISVAVLGDDHNSRVITKKEIQAGDLLFFWNTGLDKKLNHLLVVTEINENTLTYTHSFRWRNEGQYDHGVRTGTITWKNTTTSLLDDTWTEKNKTGTDNDTLQHAREAEKFEIRRLKVLE